MIQLHGYQQTEKAKIYDSWKAGNRNVLEVLPTGGGKSVIVSDVVLDGARDNMPQAVIAHRNELVAQMSSHVARRGIHHRIIGSDDTIAQITRQHRAEFGKSFVNLSAPTAVIGVDTLVRRADSLNNWGFQIRRWIIDEAHHVIKNNKWGKAVDMFPNALGLGVTATPWRTDGQGLGRHADGVFDTMIIGPTMRQLIKLGNLCDYEIVCPTSDLSVDDDDLGPSGEFTQAKLKTAAEKSHIVGDVVAAYCKYAYYKRAICFATDVKTGGKIAAQFVANGIPAVCLSAESPTVYRERCVEEFKAGKIWILVNVDLFDEGFDVPACDCVIMARPTASLGKYRQMIGRALRTAPGKTHGLIIDHVSNWVRHGFPDRHTAWTLDRRDKRAKQEKDPNEVELTACKTCTKAYKRDELVCPYCGAIPPLPSPRERTIQMVDGDLTLLDRAKLEEMRKAAEIESAGEIAVRVAQGAGGANAGRFHMNRQIEKIHAHEQLKHQIAMFGAIQRQKGISDAQAYKQFYLTWGTDVLGALDGNRTRQEYEELSRQIEKWYS